MNIFITDWKSLNEEWQNIVKKHSIIFKLLPHQLIIFILFIIFILSGISYISHHSTIKIFENDANSKIYEPLLVNEQIYKIDYSINDSVNQVCVKFNTYNRINKANYEFRIYQNNSIYYSSVFNATDIKDNEYICYDIPSISKDNISNYSVAIKPLYADSNNAIALYGNDANIALKLNKTGVILTKFTYCFILILLLINISLFILHKKES